MRIMRQTPLFAGILLGIGLVLLSVTPVFTQDVTQDVTQDIIQERALQTEGWQGKKPPPSEQRTITPAPQRPGPSGKQVLEIPVQPQRPSLPPPSQQARIPSLPQPIRPRPKQLVTVTVTDQNGGYIPGLRPGDFVVYEGETRQEITYFNNGENEPVSLGLIVDSSGSMHNKIAHAGHALRRFIHSIKLQDEVFLAGFNAQPFLVQDFTDSRMLLAQGIGLLRPRGGTSLYDAILTGLRRVKRGKHPKKALIVMTDGMDTASLSSLTQTINVSRRSGVLIYTIGIGNPQRRYAQGGGGFTIGPFGVVVGGRDERVDSKTLQRMSDETGGRHFLLNTRDVVGSKAVLDTATQTISRELRFQYSIGYASSGGGNQYRSVRVESTRPDVVVRTQKGYAAE